MAHESYELSKIARLYHQDSLNLRQIAGKLHVSAATVSRYLAEAKRQGIVEVRINDPMADFRAIEAEVESEYGLNECLVVPSYEQVANVYRTMASALDELFARLLRPQMLLGLSWGRTLKYVGEALSSQPLRRCDTIPILGAIGTVETGIYPNAISKTYADRLGGRSYLVNAPAVLDSREVRESIEKESLFQLARQSWGRLDTVLLSVSGFDRDASVSRYGVLDKASLAALGRAGVVCATNFIMLDGEGREVETELTKRMLRLSLAELKRVENRIVLAFGKSKQKSIVAALRGDIATVLITDRDTARAILSGGEEVCEELVRR